MIVLRSLVLVVAALSLGGCSMDAAYVAADRLTFDAIGNAHRYYVSADPSLSEDKKKRRQALVDSWEARLDEAESE